ncbi:MAG: hypothetical protein DRP87_15150 [Spirochaetes bacterium]|nr:MAG: hypothetical protein DRP87_15150 [Spirochaetota bacterium]
MDGAKKRPAINRIYIAGEKEYKRTEDYRRTGIPVLVPVVEVLKKRGEALGVPFEIKLVRSVQIEG